MDVRALLLLAIPAIWATIFSLPTRLPLRLLRNLGILGCYVAGGYLFASLGWRRGVVTWLVAAGVSAVIYLLHDVVVWIRHREGRRLDLGHFAAAPFTWPIMLPEAIEYLLAEAGLLGAWGGQVIEDLEMRRRS